MNTQITPLTLDITAVLTQCNATQWIDSYWHHLSAENSRVNLVSRETGPEDFRRMVAEALFPFTQLPATNGAYLDIGSGGGLPAIPVLLSGRSTGPTTLYERTRKKALALERLVTAMNIANVRVTPESFGERPLADRFSLITMSWVVLTPQLLSSIGDILVPGGCFVYYGRINFAPTGLKLREFSYSQTLFDVHKHFSIFTQ